MAEQWDCSSRCRTWRFPFQVLLKETVTSSVLVTTLGSNDLVADAGNATAAKMLTQFRTARGESYRPACFLIRANIPVKKCDAEAIRAFRNLCAVSCTTSAFAVGLESHYAAQWRTHWSDQFKFGHFIAGRSGWVQTLDGASKGADDKIPLQQPDPQFGKPSNWSLALDEPLLDRLFRCWRRCSEVERSS